MIDLTTVIICFSTIFINLVLLGLNLKLYTEYFKDRSQDKRKGEPK